MKLLTFIILLLTFSFAKAEYQKQHLFDGQYYGEFSVELDLRDPLHYNVFDNTAHDVSKYLTCRGVMAQVEIGIVVKESQVTGRTFNLNDESVVAQKCFELLNGNVTGQLDSGGNFRSWGMTAFSSLSSFQPRLVGSIREGSTFEVRQWKLQSEKFQWIKGVVNDRVN
jgi:hypothetical protein